MEEYTNYLVHHGVKGQKWGVRRFQNYDGSLTSSGKKEYYTNGRLNKAGLRKRSYYENVRRRGTTGKHQILRSVGSLYGHSLVGGLAGGLVATPLAMSGHMKAARIGAAAVQNVFMARSVHNIVTNYKYRNNPVYKKRVDNAIKSLSYKQKG